MLTASDVRRLTRDSVRADVVGPGRWWGEVAGVLVASLGVPAQWSVQAHVEDLPNDAELAELLSVLPTLGSHGFEVLVPTELADDPLWVRHGLVESYRLPSFAKDVDAGDAQRTPPDGLTVRAPTDRGEFVAAYGDWAGGRDLAQLLVTDEDLVASHLAYRVAVADGVVVGTGIIRRGDRSHLLSGIGVLEPYRRRGYGTALTVALTAEAVGATDPWGRPVEVVWMHASSDGAALYEQLGFCLADVCVALVPAGV